MAHNLMAVVLRPVLIDVSALRQGVYAGCASIHPGV